MKILEFLNKIVAGSFSSGKTMNLDIIWENRKAASCKWAEAQAFWGHLNAKTVKLFMEDKYLREKFVSPLKPKQGKGHLKNPCHFLPLAKLAMI